LIEKHQKLLNSNEEAAAFVLMNVTAGSEEQVIDDAKAIGCVKEAYLCFSIYDLILKIETNSMNELKDLLAHKYRSIKNVKSVLTLILSEENLALKPFLNYFLTDKLKKKESSEEIFSEEKSIQNFAPLILGNN